MLVQKQIISLFTCPKNVPKNRTKNVPIWYSLTPMHMLINFTWLNFRNLSWFVEVISFLP